MLGIALINCRISRSVILDAAFTSLITTDPWGCFRAQEFPIPKSLTGAFATSIGLYSERLAFFWSLCSVIRFLYSNPATQFLPFDSSEPHGMVEK